MSEVKNQVEALPSPELLRQLLRYDPETGKLWWLPRSLGMFWAEPELKRWNAHYANQEAFVASSDGYRLGHIFNRTYRAHRVIWAMQTGVWPSEQVDHINGDRSDNRWINLRSATGSENSKNRKSMQGSSSAYLGVHWSAKDRKWVAKITVSGKQVVLGFFSCEDEAARAYDAAASVHHGEFANLNFRRLAAALKEKP